MVCHTFFKMLYENLFFIEEEINGFITILVRTGLAGYINKSKEIRNYLKTRVQNAINKRRAGKSSIKK